MLTLANRKYLLKLSRRAIEKYLTSQTILTLDESDLAKELLEKRATFVTLTKNKELRGCIGELEAQKPLYQSVIDNSLASAFLDPRFSSLTSPELPDINIEISILSPLKKVSPFNNAQELLNYLQQKKPGLVIKKNGFQATFLPQVWEELPNPQDFLSQLCLKAGLPFNQWQNLDLEISEYQVEKFKES
jgi:AmmeMemoRadiSam system protein A